jgi:hypothetical protein
VIFRSLFLLFISCSFAFSAIQPSIGTAAHFLAASGMTEHNPPFTDVDILYGPTERFGKATHRWYQFSIRMGTNNSCTIRFLASRDPLAQSAAPVRIARYQVIVGADTLEYRDANTGAALLPGWGDFERFFLPHAASGTLYLDGVPRTVTLLGQLLSLHTNEFNARWQQWPNLKTLTLNREMLVGTGRNFKDAEGHRLSQKPEKHEYTYVEFKADDYRTMIDAGINLFWIAPHQEKWVRTEPVFYIRPPDGTPALQFPGDLYRANYLGYTMFIDEPAVLTIYDPKVQHVAHSYADLADLVQMRTHSTYVSGQQYGERCLQTMFKNMGVNLGDMELLQPDFPSWETRLEFGFYEMRGGSAGIVHEARYNVDGFNDELKTATGKDWKFNADDLLKIHFAILRGAARPFNKFWGTAIYGQCDPTIAPMAFIKAYDMGARYFWFWTSDHDHHLPWPEQLALARTLKEHAADHPRKSIYQPQLKRDVVITLPDGVYLPFDTFNWVEAPTSALKRQQFEEFQRIRIAALEAAKKCLRDHRDFDISIDDGRKFDGYRHVIRIH